jgi:hypothetical protein
MSELAAQDQTRVAWRTECPDSGPISIGWQMSDSEYMKLVTVPQQ